MTVDLARWQFATTSIYHFFFVPITIGMAFLVAVLQTQWHRSGDPARLKTTRFFGNLLLINVAIGVVTGLVQEFQFGMDWAAYSRFVGGVFGAPLAMEGLAAFFLESTFLGIWLFGWDRIPRELHLLSIWLVALGTALSAAFIMAANSWMQHPVGYTITKSTERADLTDIWAVLTNPVFLWGYLHVILASLITGALLMLGVSAWHLRHKRDVAAFHQTARLSLIVLIPTIFVQLLVGSQLGVIETRYQPMKIAAAEAQWTSCQPCSFSLFQIGGGNNDETPVEIIAVPHLLSVLATLSWNGAVTGLNPLQSQYQKKYGPGYYVPNVFIQYWSMRVMAYLGGLIFLLALWGGWLLWRGALDASRWFLTVALWSVVTPFFMNTAGWLLTESGRQPWIVQGLMKTASGISPLLGASWVWISLLSFVLVYIALGIADAMLMIRYARKGLPDEEVRTSGSDAATMPALTY
jgi:cytochrome d ubiquinol oxidase subunit I